MVAWRAIRMASSPTWQNTAERRRSFKVPDLTGLGSKFAAERNPVGRKWLYSWIKQPTKYHVRTVMPDLYLEPVKQKDDKGNVVAVTDPVADIVDLL